MYLVRKDMDVKLTVVKLTNFNDDMINLGWCKHITEAPSPFEKKKIDAVWYLSWREEFRNDFFYYTNLCVVPLLLFLKKRFAIYKYNVKNVCWFFLLWVW